MATKKITRAGATYINPVTGKPIVRRAHTATVHVTDTPPGTDPAAIKALGDPYDSGDASVVATERDRFEYLIGQTGNDDERPGKYAADFNSEALGDPYLGGTGWLASRADAEAVAAVGIAHLRALEARAGFPDDPAHAPYATIVSAERTDSDDPVVEDLYTGDDRYADRVADGAEDPPRALVLAGYYGDDARDHAIAEYAEGNGWTRLDHRYRDDGWPLCTWCDQPAVAQQWATTASHLRHPQRPDNYRCSAHARALIQPGTVSANVTRPRAPQPPQWRRGGIHLGHDQMLALARNEI